jgi:3-deoxy-D-manno-octulosonic acid kinase
MNGGSRPAIDVTRLATPDGAILFDRDRLAQADPRMLQPGHWHEAANDASRGGRGAVWLVRGEFGQGVLRHYRRGGFFGRLNRDRYLWRGEEATRSFREFRLLAELRRRGLSVPAPLAAGYSREGPFYRADLLTALIADAHTFAQRLAADFPSTGIWARIGATLSRFHAAGVFHADLNAHNVMIDAADEVWLIDFDRGELRHPARAWAQANLDRLRRSLRKLGADRVPGFDAAWTSLLDAYGQPGRVGA